MTLHRVLLVGGPRKGEKWEVEHPYSWWGLLVRLEDGGYKHVWYRRTRRESKDGRIVYQYDVEETKKRWQKGEG